MRGFRFDPEEKWIVEERQRERESEIARLTACESFFLICDIHSQPEVMMLRSCNNICVPSFVLRKDKRYRQTHLALPVEEVMVHSPVTVSCKLYDFRRKKPKKVNCTISCTSKNMSKQQNFRGWMMKILERNNIPVHTKQTAHKHTHTHTHTEEKPFERVALRKTVATSAAKKHLASEKKLLGPLFV